MRYSKVLLVATLFSTSAFAMHCPSKMAEIDAMLESNPPADSAQRLEVIALREEGERLHEAGNHAESSEKLKQALELLGSTE